MRCSAAMSGAASRPCAWAAATPWRWPSSVKARCELCYFAVSSGGVQMADPKVGISSTARDLPDQRKEVMDACLRLSMLPKMMEHMPAIDAEAISASLALVDEADIYIGVFAHRYGYVPKEKNPQQISITEMEYNRAVERGIPCLIFLMHEDHPVKAADVETGEGAIKLKAFNERIATSH